MIPHISFVPPHIVYQTQGGFPGTTHPAITINLFLGMFRLTFFRLFTRAPLTSIYLSICCHYLKGKDTTFLLKDKNNYEKNPIQKATSWKIRYGFNQYIIEILLLFNSSQPLRQLLQWHQPLGCYPCPGIPSSQRVSWN